MQGMCGGVMVSPAWMTLHTISAPFIWEKTFAFDTFLWLLLLFVNVPSSSNVTEKPQPEEKGEEAL